MGDTENTTNTSETANPTWRHQSNRELSPSAAGKVFLLIEILMAVFQIPRAQNPALVRILLKEDFFGRVGENFAGGL